MAAALGRQGETVKAVIALAELGHIQRDIADIVGVTRQRVSQIVQHNAIKCRGLRQSRINEKINNWTIIGIDRTSRTMYRAVCKCGVERTYPLRSLRKTKQCRQCYSSEQLKIRVGDKFNDWEVIAAAISYASRGRCWLCRCKCGVEKNVSQSNLMRDLSKQCRKCGYKSRTKMST
jgi:hypothetical protein